MTESPSKSLLSSPKFLVILATILNIPFLSFYWMSLGRFLPHAMVTHTPAWLSPLTAVLYLPAALFSYLVFGNLYIYVLATIAGITIAVWGLIKARRGRLVRLWLLLLMCGTIAFPLVFHYQAALVAAPGYKMQVVTEPGIFEGVIKTSKNLLEQTPCEYELLGWSADNQLYYRVVCGAQTQIWRYSPVQQSAQVQASSGPSDLSASTLPKDAVLKMVRAADVHPEEYEATTRSLLLKSKGVVSPDSRWTAIVAQHIYGTQDVIVLSPVE